MVFCDPEFNRSNLQNFLNFLDSPSKNFYINMYRWYCHSRNFTYSLQICYYWYLFRKKLNKFWISLKFSSIALNRNGKAYLRRTLVIYRYDASKPPPPIMPMRVQPTNGPSKRQSSNEDGNGKVTSLLLSYIIWQQQSVQIVDILPLVAKINI